MSSTESSRGEALATAMLRVKDAIRSDATDPSHRAAYFQLLCVCGDWDRAVDQLKLIEGVDPPSALFAQAYCRAIRCEIERKAVAAGEAPPVVFGEPAPWVGFLIEAFRLGVEGDWAAALALRDQAYEMAPPSPGTLNAEPVEWIADADSRFGPILEAFVEGHYRWVPFQHVQEITFHPPKHLIDAIWLPARLVWTNGGAVDGLIPARYAGSESSATEAIQRGFQTEWCEKVPGYFVGLGQKSLATETMDLPLLDLRHLALSPAVTT